MRALCWHGIEDIRLDTVPDPRIRDARDAIVRITSTAICGSDLHLFGGFVPYMEEGDIVGHEAMGEVVEVGRDVTKLRPGDRVVVPFTVSCGGCLPCRKGNFALCDMSNPNTEMALDAFAGGQAEYLRVPFADVGPLKIPDDLRDEQVLFLSDILPTGYQAVENA